MANGKNSIIVYRDWIDIFDELTDDEAGKLIKHFFRYVNDLNPEVPDRLTGLMFKQIKSTLKRDLKKWEEKSEKNRENARLRWDKNNTNACERKKRNAKNADSVSDSDNDSVSDNDSISLKKKQNNNSFNFKHSLLELGIEKSIVESWLKVRKTKKAVNTEIAFNGIMTQIEKSGLTPNDCIKLSVENSWAGFKAEWVPNELQNNIDFKPFK